MSVGDRYIGEQLRPTDIVGLIDSDTGNIDAALMPTLSGASYVSANQTDRLAGTHTGGTVVGGFVVGDVVYQVDTGAYWLVASLPSSVAGNWAPWSVFASSTDTGGGIGNAGKLLALDANGKADGRDLATDGTKLDGIAAGAAALTSSTPAALGVAAVGVATTAARGDHVHSMPSAADVGADPAGTTATHAALTTAHGSTALNTASAIVQRDASGNFAAGTITANLTGTASGNDVVGAAAAVQSNLTTHINDGTGAHAASAISVTPSGNLAATTVAAALTEHQGDIDTINSTISALPVSQGGSGGSSGALASIDGVSNAGGNVDLVEGTGVTITPNDGANTITFAIGQSVATSASPSFAAVTSTVATGTPPVSATSTTVCPSLNADLLDGSHASVTSTASTIPIADGSGKLAAAWGGSASGLATLNSSTRVVEDVAYTAADETKWNGAPVAVRPSLDELASRMRSAETGTLTSFSVNGGSATYGQLNFVGSPTSTVQQSGNTVTITSPSGTWSTELTIVAKQDYILTHAAVTDGHLRPVAVTRTTPFTASILQFNNNITDSGITRTWTNTGALTYNTGKFGDASLRLAGTYLTTPDTSNLYGANSYTFQMWVRRTSNFSVARLGLCHQTNGGGAVAKWFVYLDASNTTDAKLAFHVNGTASLTLQESSAFTWAADTWYHIAVTVESLSATSCTARIFRDGTQLGTSTLGSAFPNSTGSLTIGRAEDHTTGTFPGDIDDFRFDTTNLNSGSSFTVPVSEHSALSRQYEHGPVDIGAIGSGKTIEVGAISSTQTVFRFSAAGTYYVGVIVE